MFKNFVKDGVKIKKIIFLFVVLLSVGFSKDLLRLGAEAYIRGDYKTAVEQFEKKL